MIGVLVRDEDGIGAGEGLASVNMPGSSTSVVPSCSSRMQAWPNFVIRMSAA